MPGRPPPGPPLTHAPTPVRPFTRSTEYAIRALTHLALNKEGGRYHLAREMSKELGIPAPFLGKILQPLVMRGILESQRGRNGGFRLCREPEEVTLFDIANSQLQEPIYEKRVCFLGQAECTDERGCPMHEYWKLTWAEFEEKMSRTTLLGLVEFCRTTDSSNYPLPEDSPEDAGEAPAAASSPLDVRASEAG